MIRKTLKGIVVSDKMAKTVVVRVSRLKKLPKYRKYVRVWKHYKAHYDAGRYEPGETVIIEETRPISKEKRWRVVERTPVKAQEKSQ